MEERKTTVKPFLKRKTEAVKSQKVTWKNKSRIDCWNKPENPKKFKVFKEKKQPQLKEMQHPIEQNQQNFNQNNQEFKVQKILVVNTEEDDTVPDEEESDQEFHKIKTKLI